MVCLSNEVCALNMFASLFCYIGRDDIVDYLKQISVCIYNFLILVVHVCVKSSFCTKKTENKYFIYLMELYFIVTRIIKKNNIVI